MPSLAVKSHFARIGWVVRLSPIHRNGRFALSQIRTLVVGCKGSLLLETVVSVMVFSMVGVAVLAGLNTSYRAGAKVEAQAEAENIARNQMESVFSQPYRAPGQTAYSAITTTGGYAVSTVMEDVDPGAPDPDIEKVTVTISRDGQDILILTGLRFNDS